MSHEPVLGTVREWSNEDGWGVLLTSDGLTVFCHYSQLEMDGYRTLAPGSRVEFDYETPGQDGCDARVLTAARPSE
jgi:CspA family cold shock protein